MSKSGDDGAAAAQELIEAPKFSGQVDDVTAGAFEDIDELINLGKHAPKARNAPGGLADKAASISDEAALDALGLTGSQRAKLAKEIGKKRYGQVARMLKELETPDGKRVLGTADNAEAIAAKLEDTIRGQGEKLGETYRVMDDAIASGKTVKRVNAGALADDLEKWVAKKFSKDVSDLGIQATKAGRRLASRLRKSGDLGFDEASKQRRQFQNSWKASKRSGAEGAASVERQLSKMIKQHTDDAIRMAGPDILPAEVKKAFFEANDIYAGLSKVSEMSSKRAIQLAGNRGLSLSDNIMMGGQMAGALASGEGVGAAGIEGVAMGAVHNQIRDRGSAILSRGAEWVSKLDMLNKAVKTTEKTVKKGIKQYIKSAMDGGSGERVSRQPAIAALQNALSGSGPTKGDPRILAKARSEELQEMLMSPERLSEQIALSVGAFENAAPKTAAAIAAKSSEVAGFLHSKAPVNPMPAHGSSARIGSPLAPIQGRGGEVRSVLQRSHGPPICCSGPQPRSGPRGRGGGAQGALPSPVRHDKARGRVAAAERKEATQV